MITLRGITWEHPRGYDCLVAAAAAYRDLTGVAVDWRFRSLQAFADQPLTELAAEYDLLVIDHPHIPAAATEGLLAPLDGHGFDDQLRDLAEHRVGRSHLSYRHDDHQYGLATDVAAQVAAYRPDLLPEPPPDWPAVLDLARDGRVLWPAKPIDAYSSLITVATGLGHPPTAEPGRFLDHDAGLEALDLLHRLAELVPAECLTQNPIQVAEALATGDRWCYAPLLFGYTNYSRAGFRTHRLRYTDIPMINGAPAGSLLGGAGIAVSALRQAQGTSAVIDEARRFAFWVASAEVQRGVYFDGGGQPGHGAAWADDRLNAETLDFFRGTRATLEGAYLRPRSLGYMEFQDTASPWVTAALRGELTDEELLRRLDEAADRWLR
ncbi:extracellular solute-binding protein [Microlunatus parietis]|uniref:Multiple sugar transport system substrate-binding protein n=1 Tax=Microlunatus parietis TaxID=682979 RepID=A0A7Y9LE25_9ACTN|nr:extracellular solute-binding protein [Microlunatus parietis]NYE73440.1 multiple sugar transport system substrate-binding protein [Microlunatus parietis]